jgi:hypothetical protein
MSDPKQTGYPIVDRNGQRRVEAMPDPPPLDLRVPQLQTGLSLFAGQDPVHLDVSVREYRLVTVVGPEEPDRCGPRYRWREYHDADVCCCPEPGCPCCVGEVDDIPKDNPILCGCGAVAIDHSGLRPMCGACSVASRVAELPLASADALRERDSAQGLLDTIGELARDPELGASTRRRFRGAVQLVRKAEHPDAALFALLVALNSDEPDDPRLPPPGLMLVDCKACELSKSRYARDVPPGCCGGFDCSQCGRQWSYDSDTREWTLVGHAFTDDDGDS